MGIFSFFNNIKLIERVSILEVEIKNLKQEMLNMELTLYNAKKKKIFKEDKVDDEPKGYIPQ